jgi:hypothetical protein
MTRLAEQCRDVRSHGNDGLGRAAIQPAVCTGIHDVSSPVRPRRVAVLRLSNGMTTTLRLSDREETPERGATVFVRGGRGMGDQPTSGGVVLASTDPSWAQVS